MRHPSCSGEYVCRRWLPVGIGAGRWIQIRAMRTLWPGVATAFAADAMIWCGVILTERGNARNRWTVWRSMATNVR